jgi:hypothetical protein
MKGQRCSSVQLAWLPLLVRDLFVTKLSTGSFIYVNTFQGGRASVLRLLLAYWLSVNRQTVSSQHWRFCFSLIQLTKLICNSSHIFPSLFQISRNLVSYS